MKDVAALEQELAALAKRQNDLEDIELAVMETRRGARGGARRRAAPRSTTSTPRIAEATAAGMPRWSGIDERASSTAARTAPTIAGKVPDELLALYEKQRARYGVGASHAAGRRVARERRRAQRDRHGTMRAAAPDDVLLCPDSNAVLVRTGESGL